VNGDANGRGPRSLAPILESLDHLAREGVLPSDIVLELRDKIRTNRFDLVVAGQFKRGKSTLINAFVGADVLPVAVVPLTSIVTALSFAPRPAARVVSTSGAEQAISMDQLADYVTERCNPGNAKGVREVVVGYPSEWLARGVRLIDTPGVGSVYAHNTAATERFLPKSDAVIFVLSVDQPLSDAELEFLASVRAHSDKIFFVLNKADLVTRPELDESTDFSRRALASALGRDPLLFAVSARLALQGRIEGSDSLVARSGLRELERAITQFLDRDRESTFLSSIARQLRRAVSAARLELQLELRSLLSPLEELRRKAAFLHERRAALLTASGDADLLLRHEAAQAMQAPFEKALAAFSLSLADRVRHSVREAARGDGGAGLYGRLTGAARQEIVAAFDAWRQSQAGELERQFRALCERHARNIDAAIDEIRTQAAALYSIAFSPREAPEFHRVETDFDCRIDAEATGLALLRTALVDRLPGWLAGPMVVRRVAEDAASTVDMLAGRLRRDVATRTHKAVGNYLDYLDRRVDRAVAGLEGAMERASSLRAEGDAAVQARCEAIGRLCVELDEVDAVVASAWT